MSFGFLSNTIKTFSENSNISNLVLTNMEVPENQTTMEASHQQVAVFLCNKTQI